MFAAFTRIFDQFCDLIEVINLVNMADFGKGSRLRLEVQDGTYEGIVVSFDPRQGLMSLKAGMINKIYIWSTYSIYHVDSKKFISLLVN